MIVVHWAQQHRRPITGALLAAPPDFESPLPEGYPTQEVLQANGWLPTPRAAVALSEHRRGEHATIRWDATNASMRSRRRGAASSSIWATSATSIPHPGMENGRGPRNSSASCWTRRGASGMSDASSAATLAGGGWRGSAHRTGRGSC